MNRRECITLLGSAAAGWPVATWAQQAVPVVGYLNSGSLEAGANLVAAFRKGLGEAGFVEGRNVALEFRGAENDVSRLPELAADLVRRRVAVIATGGGAAPALAAKSLTTNIPIVFTSGGDPVQAGLVASSNRPGGNVTGFIELASELGAKRLGLLHQALPRAAHVGMVVRTGQDTRDVQQAAAALGLQLEVLTADTPGDLDVVFATLPQKRIEALLINFGRFFYERRVQLATLAARQAVPAMYYSRDFAEVGGLMSYGASLADNHRQVGIYVGRILKGEKPADLPVMQPTKFELVLNIKTAKALGLTVPPTLLAIADEVIE